jgi:hypothetical protein
LLELDNKGLLKAFQFRVTLTPVRITVKKIEDRVSEGEELVLTVQLDFDFT